MGNGNHFFNLNNLEQGIQRQLTDGITTRIFPGDQAMLSVVTLAPNASGTVHSHDEEQWGVMLEGEAVRIQDGEEISVQKRRFLAYTRWRASQRSGWAARGTNPGCIQPTAGSLQNRWFWVW